MKNNHLHLFALAITAGKNKGGKVASSGHLSAAMASSPLLDLAVEIE